MELIVELLVLMGLHLYSDLVLQPESISTAKHERKSVLVLHCLLYTVPFAVVFWNLPFIAVVFSSHFIIDLLSSNISHYFYGKGKLRRCADVICIDQALHYAVLFIAYYYFAR